MNSKKLKMTEISTLAKEMSDIDVDISDSLWSKLPNEIIVKIFCHLSIESLIAVTKVGCKRLTLLACTFHKYDFSSWNTISDEDMSAFFVKERTTNLLELSLSNLVFVSPANLTKHISRCKNLTDLSVTHCGISYRNLCTIAENCPEIQELSWSVCADRQTRGELLKAPKGTELTKMRKLNLWADEADSSASGIVKDMCERLCNEGTDVCLNFSSEFSRHLPNPLLPCASLFNIRLFSFEPEAKLLVKSNHPFGYAGKVDLGVCDNLVLFNKMILSKEAFFFGNISRARSIVGAFPDFFQFTAGVDLPASDAKHVPERIIVFLGEDYLALESATDVLKNAFGNMKHFAFSVDIGSEISKAFVMPKFVEIIRSAKNLTELNLAGLHSEEFPLSVLNCLEKLNSLCLPACALSASPEGVSEFHKLTTNNKNVEHFLLCPCRECDEGPSDKSFALVAHWTRLKSLILRQVVTFRLCTFLPKVAESCPELTRLEIVGVGPDSVCHYTPMLNSMLKKAPQLRFVKINQPHFYVMDRGFWRAVSTLENLQGLCLCSILTTFVENKIVVESIKKLRFFHLFHLGVSNHCDSLESLIRKGMKANGVKNKRIEIYPRCGVECSKAHF